MHMSMHLATRPTSCMTGQVHMLVSYIALLPGQYLDIARERGQYPDIAWEGGF